MENDASETRRTTTISSTPRHDDDESNTINTDDTNNNYNNNKVPYRSHSAQSRKERDKAESIFRKKTLQMQNRQRLSSIRITSSESGESESGEDEKREKEVEEQLLDANEFVRRLVSGSEKKEKKKKKQKEDEKNKKEIERFPSNKDDDDDDKKKKLNSIKKQVGFVLPDSSSSESSGFASALLQIEKEIIETAEAILRRKLPGERTTTGIILTSPLRRDRATMTLGISGEKKSRKNQDDDTEGDESRKAAVENKSVKKEGREQTTRHKPPERSDSFKKRRQNEFKQQLRVAQTRTLDMQISSQQDLQSYFTLGSSDPGSRTTFMSEEATLLQDSCASLLNDENDLLVKEAMRFEAMRFQCHEPSSFPLQAAHEGEECGKDTENTVINEQKIPPLGRI